MNKIKPYLEDAAEVVLSFKGTFIRQFKNDGKINNINIDSFGKDDVEVHRSIICTNGDLWLYLDIDFHNTTLEDGVIKSLESARNIEAVLPKQFAWFFSGRGIHGHSLIKYNKENEIAITRFGNIFQFYKTFLKMLAAKSHVDLDKTFVHYKGLCRAPYSLNAKTGLYKVPIDIINDKTSEVLHKAKNRVYADVIFKPINVKDALKEMPPPITFKKEQMDFHKIDVNWEAYPPCIHTMMQLKNKGNNERYTLLTYFNALHKKYDVRTIMKQILTKTEYYHMQKEGQLEYVCNRNYAPPTCQFFVSGEMCTGCGRVHPALVKYSFIKKDEK